MRLLELIHRAFHQSETRLYRWVNGAVWALIFLSVGLFVAELAFGIYRQADTWLHVIDDVILVVFAIEISLRIGSYRPAELDLFELDGAARLRIHLRGRVRFLMRPLNLVDLFTVLALVPELRGLRALRLLRLLRTAGLFRYSRPFERIARGFHENRLPFYFAFTMLGAEVLLGGISLYLVEGRAHGSVASLGDGFWWALVTLTTVGFGDITPTTDLGRVIGSVLMIGGMFTLALFAGIIGHTFLNILISLREEQYRMADYADHVVICGYHPGARALLDDLVHELPADTPMVIIADRERDPLVSPTFLWVTGDPTKEIELEKVRLTHAARAVVIAPRQMDSQQADATTLMTTFTLRSFLRKHEGGPLIRKRPLWIVAEILEEENVAHARAAGADEVIESTGVAFSMLAHAAAHPGSGSIVGSVATAGALNVYLGVMPAGDGGEPTFEQLARLLKKQYDALLIGVRDPATRLDRFNPPDTLAIPRQMKLIYLAERAVLPT